jgi:hypothetical protein
MKVRGEFASGVLGVVGTASCDSPDEVTQIFGKILRFVVQGEWVFLRNNCQAQSLAVKLVRIFLLCFVFVPLSHLHPIGTSIRLI